MVEIIEIKKFLKTGNFGEFGEISFGIKREKLIELLGATEWIHYTSKKSKFPSIFKYGKLEFYFEEGEEGRLNGIQILPTIQEADLLNLKINYDFLKPNLKFEAAIKILEAESIKYKLVTSEFDSDDIRRVETEGKVQLIFSEDFDETISIHKVSKFVELNSNQIKMKQVNFSIPESEYQKLREQAIKTGKSIQSICKKIILDNLNKK